MVWSGGQGNCCLDIPQEGGTSNDSWGFENQKVSCAEQKLESSLSVQRLRWHVNEITDVVNHGVNTCYCFENLLMVF